MLPPHTQEESMASSRKLAKAGVLFPEELAELIHVYDAGCLQGDIDPVSDDAVDAALRLLRAYRNGIRDPRLLRNIAAGHHPRARAIH